MQHQQFFDEQFGNLEKLLKEKTQLIEVVRTTARSLEASAKMLLTEEEQKEVLASRHLLKSLLTNNHLIIN